MSKGCESFVKNKTGESKRRVGTIRGFSKRGTKRPENISLDPLLTRFLHFYPKPVRTPLPRLK